MGYKDSGISRALLSVSDKTGIVELAQCLARHKVQIISTGNTAKFLKGARIAVTDISCHTEFPEIMDGRVKTLHPKIHGGILADRENQKHMTALEIYDITKIDMVVVNLYPFMEVVKQGGSFAEVIENIDIGGPAMVRSAGKNHKYTTVLTSPNQYQSIIDEMDSNSGATSAETRLKLARQAFTHIAEYDINIANWFANLHKDDTPEKLFMVGDLKQDLRYGENPHQSASLYKIDSDTVGVVGAQQLRGKELSYNNINDADIAFEIVCEYDSTACAIIKHATPCGIALGDTVVTAWQQAKSCDPLSAFGGIVAFNSKVDVDLALAISDMFLEVIIAPEFTPEFIEAVSGRENLRILQTGKLFDKKSNINIVKHMADGLLVQSRDNGMLQRADCEVVTDRKPNATEWQDLMFAWKAVKNVKSNAIVYAKNCQTVGIGAGQTSRIDAAKFASQRANQFLSAESCVVASDGFFPFADGLQVCIDSGITAVIQPGGSKNDDEVIKCANSAGIAMVITKMRHFKH